MLKRKFDEISKDEEVLNPRVKKHTLDSDEEDSGEDDEQNVLDEEQIEGEEIGDFKIDGATKITPFNMKEEMEEGHFDRDGHFLWKKVQGDKDAWLENIDWITVKQTPTGVSKLFKDDGNSSDEDDEQIKKKDLTSQYQEIFEMMQPGETVSKTLQRIGKARTKMSTIERWRQKKSGNVDAASEQVTKLTELCNDILTETGNMDVYEETYDKIKAKLKKDTKSDDLDMYDDDFIAKEIEKKNEPTTSEGTSSQTLTASEQSDTVLWEFKWKDEDSEIYGPYNSEQMQMWTTEGYFKDGVLVRKSGAESTNFYTSKRVDFELYL